MRARLLAAVVIVVPAWLLTPLQQQIHRERDELKYGGITINRELRDQIGQGLAIALLAGFRGVVADFIWIRSHSHWEKKEWVLQAEAIENTVKLQPQSTLFWDVGAWHMAWNIGYAERVDTNNVTEAQGIARERLWHLRAKAFLERGLQNVPNRFDLYFKLGWLYQHKLLGHCGGDKNCERATEAKIAEYFGKAARFPEAPAYIARSAARAIERSGDLRGAYQVWLEIWAKEGQHPDALNRSILEREIRRIEDELNLPADARVFPPRPAPPAPADPT
jgi:hypothetical protein